MPLWVLSTFLLPMIFLKLFIYSSELSLWHGFEWSLCSVVHFNVLCLCRNAFIGIIRKGGMHSLYAGWGAVLCRNIPHSIIKVRYCCILNVLWANDRRWLDKDDALWLFSLNTFFICISPLLTPTSEFWVFLYCDV